MSRFDRCDERFYMASGTGFPVSAPILMSRACIRASAVAGLVSLMACTPPMARLDGDQARNEVPAGPTNKEVESSDEPPSPGGSQVSLVPSDGDFAGLAATIGTPRRRRPIWTSRPRPQGRARWKRSMTIGSKSRSSRVILRSRPTSGESRRCSGVSRRKPMIRFRITLLPRYFRSSG